jgi:CPA2 family monovalent cation:H+ antiporter-2
MESTVVVDFVWVVLFAAFAGVLSNKLNLPFVALLLFFGMFIGPNFTSLVKVEAIQLFADIGAILLLFLVGVEFNISKMLSVGIRAVFATFVLMFLTFLVIYEGSLFLGLAGFDAILVASMFSMSSTAIMIKNLEQKGLVDMPEVPTLIAILVIEDIVAVFLLAIFSNLGSSNFTTSSFLTAFSIGLGALVFCYLILADLLKKFSAIFLQNASIDLLVLVSFSLGILMSAIASLVGISPAIGSFLAGSLISGVPRSREIEHSMRSFSLVFSSFFFMSVGLLINPAELMQSGPLTIALILLFMTTVFLSSAFAFFLINPSGRSAIFAGAALIPLGEFSLLIAKEGMALSSVNLVSIASVGVLISSIVASLAIDRRKSVYLNLRTRLPGSFFTTLDNFSHYLLGVISSFEPGGYFHRVFLDEMKKSIFNVLFITGSVLFLFPAQVYLSIPLQLFGKTHYLSQLLILVVLLICVIPLYRLLQSAKRLMDALSSVFSRTTPSASKGQVFRNFVIAVASFLIFLNFRLIISSLYLPDVFIWFSIVFVVVSIFFFWSTIRAISFGLFLSDRRVDFLKPKITVLEDDVVVVGSKPSKNKKKESHHSDEQINEKLNSIFHIKR